MKSDFCVDSSDFADFKITLPQSCPTGLHSAVAHKKAKVYATAGCKIICFTDTPTAARPDFHADIVSDPAGR